MFSLKVGFICGLGLLKDDLDLDTDLVSRNYCSLVFLKYFVLIAHRWVVGLLITNQLNGEKREDKMIVTMNAFPEGLHFPFFVTGLLLIVPYPSHH